ncbi:RASEF protein, partial [Upupa epops]|nr:RASEF protein [Upupa epops]
HYRSGIQLGRRGESPRAGDPAAMLGTGPTQVAGAQAGSPHRHNSITPGLRYRSIAQSYFHKAHGVLLLYDISNPGSFLSVRQWIEDIKAHSSLFCETSAKDGTNVVEAVLHLAR